MKIKSGDNVVVISGKDRGKRGKVLEASPRKSRIVVEGVNLKKKHVRPRRAREKGQIVEMPAPLHVSSVKLMCPKCGKSSRVGRKVSGKEKVRICKECDEPLAPK